VLGAARHELAGGADERGRVERWGVDLRERAWCLWTAGRGACVCCVCVRVRVSCLRGAASRCELRGGGTTGAHAARGGCRRCEQRVATAAVAGFTGRTVRFVSACGVRAWSVACGVAKGWGREPPPPPACNPRADWANCQQQHSTPFARCHLVVRTTFLAPVAQRGWVCQYSDMGEGGEGRGGRRGSEERREGAGEWRTGGIVIRRRERSLPWCAGAARGTPHPRTSTACMTHHEHTTLTRIYSKGHTLGLRMAWGIGGKRRRPREIDLETVGLAVSGLALCVCVTGSVPSALLCCTGHMGVRGWGSA